MKVIGSLVIKNEADRYLRACLEHMRPCLDELFVWDDQSTDDSVEIAREYTDHVYVRPEDQPSFLDHEGYFRFNAWKQLESSLNPTERDWILSFDADEFLVNVLGETPRKGLTMATDYAAGNGCVGVILRFPEVFDIQDGIPQIRVDGLWDTIRGPRLFAYRKAASWSNKPMGCGSEPTYVARGRLSRTDFGLVMLHYGYANPEEHQAKYERYSSLNQHGHNNAHVESIIGKKKLIPWQGPVPKI